MPFLSDVPVDVLLDNMLPSIPVSDLLNLASTNRFFAILGADDTFWKRKLLDDFNFSGAGTARTSGWKVIYKGMSKPRIYTWGRSENTHGRLGLSKLPKSTLEDVPFPSELRIPNVRIVSLIAGGWSFHALDSEGNVFVWGTMDGTQFALNSDGYDEPSKRADTPHKLALPCPMRSISCGRTHSSGLDANSQIWTFLSWGRPFKLVSPLLDGHSPEHTATQVESGWNFSSALTKSGDVLVWFPLDQPMSDVITAKNDALNAEHNYAIATNDKVIPCVTWYLDTEATIPAPANINTNIPPNQGRLLSRLPALPSLQPLGFQKDEIKLIKIAALDNRLIALTNHGHVLKFDGLNGTVPTLGGRWQYLPNFSQVDRIQNHPVFSAADDKPNQHGLQPPESMQITHISAHYQTFVAYSTGSSSVVLIGDKKTDEGSKPKVIPQLQNQSVISVVLGDYHYGALTATGKLLTWGSYSKGALGLGDPADIEPGQPGGFLTQNHRQMAITRRRGQPTDVEVPTPVRFDHGGKKKDMFCFAATAAGWHMGALAIDLETDGDEEQEEQSEEEGESHMPGHFDSSAPPPQPSENVPQPGWTPGLGGLGGFRVGFAGRGLNRGGLGRGRAQ